jgi:hypothetical protein
MESKSMLYIALQETATFTSIPRVSFQSLYSENLDAHHIYDRLCGLVVRVSGYRYRGLGFDSRRYQIF